MNPSMQSLGYGLAALLFCVGIYFLCQEIKKLSYRFLHHRNHNHGIKRKAVKTTDKRNHLRWIIF